MKCVHCGKDIENGSRFCTFCGRENQPQQAPQTEMPVQPQRPEPPVLPDVQWVHSPRTEMPQGPVWQQTPPRQNVPQAAPAGYPEMPGQKRGGALKWVLVSVWLVLVIAGWAAALLLTMGGRTVQVKNPGANETVSNGGLTEGKWYQWDESTDTLYCWTFDEDGTAVYGIPGKNENSTVAYSVDSSGAVVIGYDDAAAVWEYDSTEDCYWLYTAENRKTRIFRASDYPGGNAACYSYRIEGGNVHVPVSYENITSMNLSNAELLLRWYSKYGMFGVCPNTEDVSADEAQAVLRSLGLTDIYNVYRVSCCHSIAESRAHVSHYLGDGIVEDTYRWEVDPTEYNGNLYWIVAPMGYSGLHVNGDLTDCGNGVWTLPLAEYDTGDLTGSFMATFAKVNGTIKLISVEKTVSTGALTEDAAWELINRAYFDNILTYFARGGNIDEADVYHIYPFNDPANQVDCPSVVGVDTQEDMLRLLCQCYTDSYARELLQRYQVVLEQGNTNREGWFEHNGTIYFVPIYARGSQGLLREGMTLTQTGENTWTATVAMEFTEDRMDFHIVCEDGIYKLDY